MKCLRAIEQICEALGEDLDSPMCREIQEHLDECEECCAYVDSIKRTVYFCRQQLSKKDVPAEVDARLWKVLNLTKP